MLINFNTKYDIGQQVFFVERSTSHETVSCEHCNGNYREIVNGIEYTCPYCKGGRSSRTIDTYRVRSGVITNIRISLLGIDKMRSYDLNSKDKFDTNIKYSVTENRTENSFSDIDGNSTSKFERELFATEQEAEAAITVSKTVKYTSR
jgi:hypothetical protein